MLLANKIKDDRVLLGIGQMAMVIGLVALKSSGVLGDSIEKTFFNGFLLGVGGAFLGLSVPVNLTVILRMRRNRQSSGDKNVL